jgi:hypothetical protein
LCVCCLSLLLSARGSENERFERRITGMVTWRIACRQLILPPSPPQRRRSLTCMTKKTGMPMPAPRPQMVAMMMVMVSLSSSIATCASSWACCREGGESSRDLRKKKKLGWVLHRLVICCGGQ